jgi:drug/metabolite transporter (DMT)-like permease
MGYPVMFRPPPGRPARCTISRRSRVVLAFALVYIFWGSTYLGIRVAVERIPPILMAGTRFFIAGTLMLGCCAVIGRRVTVTRDQLWRLAIIGIMLLSISNAVLAWAELYVPTGLAALIIAISPIWFLLIDRYLVRSGDRIGRAGLAGIVLGVAGMVVLLWPRLTASHPLGWWELVAATSLLGSSFCWSLGSVVARHWRIGVDPLVGSGWQMTIAGSVNLALGLALGQHHAARWDAPGVTAVLYLVVFGSWVGFSAYVWLLRHVPTSKVATYAYVNPVVAVFLGWLVLGESVDPFMILGTAIIVPAVALVTGATTEPASAPAARQPPNSA